MRKLTFALVGVLLAGIAAVSPALAPVTQAATTNPKVAIIVGATEGTTSTYRSDANQVYAEAIKYTSNVVRVYSPNATWSKVKAAINGASIIVYLGHGNGWPSPYTYDPNYTTKDGFGLNDPNNLSDNVHKYYGEPSIATLTPAPNAVVLLFHLCYASGNSEPQNAAPTLSVAKQRVDNYASAFLKAGARAVIANGHSHDPYYIRALFTTKQTIDQYWRNAPDFHNHVTSYGSSRSSGYTFQMDPESSSSYYRSITGKMSLRTEDVTGAAYASTAGDPGSFVIPGAASASLSDPGSPVYGDAAAAAAMDPAGETAHLPYGTKVRIDAASVATASDGSRVFPIHSLDGAVTGFMRSSTLVPRDSTSPRVWEVDDGTGAFSPNGDGSQDAFQLNVTLSEPASWSLRVIAPDKTTQIATGSGSSSTGALAFTWKPAKGSVADGTYTWSLVATDAWGNTSAAKTGPIVVDTRAPSLSLAAAETSTIPTFTPNGDGSRDTIGFATSADEPGTVITSVHNQSGTAVDTLSTAAGSATTVTWDGRTSSGSYVADGVYELSFRAQDRAGNRSPAQTTQVAVYGSLKSVASSKSIFYPQDGDAVSTSTKLTFTLKSAATVSWRVINAAGATVRTIRTAVPLAAGSYAWYWNGRNDSGAYVPVGTYRSVVSATNGAQGATQSVSVLADAFRITVSDTTPARGQKITVTATTAEALSAAAKVRIYQPGVTAWTVTMSRVSTSVYRATITLKAGSTGTLRIKVSGVDPAGHTQSSSRLLPIH